MQLGAELFCIRDVMFDGNTFIEMGLYGNGTLIPGSPGRDEFESPACLRAGSRVSATGRLSLFYTNPLLMHGHTRPAWTVDTDALSTFPSRLSVLVRSNAFLEPLYFVNTFSIHLVMRDPKVIRVYELANPSIGLNWIGRGTFTVELPPDWHLPHA